MGCIEIYPTYEAVWYAVQERMQHALRKHPETLTDAERIGTVLDELKEAREAFDEGDMWTRAGCVLQDSIL